MHKHIMKIWNLGNNDELILVAENHGLVHVEHEPMCLEALLWQD